MKDYKLLQKKYLVNTYANRGLTIISGQGLYLKDISGDTYLDVMSNYGVSIFGHSHPKVISTLTAQLQKIITLHTSFNNDKRSEWNSGCEPLS